MVYKLYATNATTVVAIPSPHRATFEQVSRGFNGDGSERIARKAVVTWQYRKPISAADFQKFSANKAANGLIVFETWRKPIGAVAGQFVKMRGRLTEISGIERDGEYHGVGIKVIHVEEA